MNNENNNNNILNNNGGVPPQGVTPTPMLESNINSNPSAVPMPEVRVNTNNVTPIPEVLPNPNVMPTQSISNEPIDTLFSDNIPPVNNQMPYVQPVSNVNMVGQTPTPNYANPLSDEELLRCFVGNNYDKITKRPFNFAGFFLGTLYMFYRKMFLYALILFTGSLIISSVINNYFISLLFNVLVGLLVNKVYLYYAKQKIAKIKANNVGKSPEEIKSICASKGGTSIGKSFLGFLAEIGIVILVLIVMILMGINTIFKDFLDPNNWNISINNGDINDVDNSFHQNNGEEEENKETLLEDVIVTGHACLGSKCSISIEDADGKEDNYAFDESNDELLTSLGDYSDYIKLNIYYTSKDSDKTITKYQIINKNNNEDISNVRNEEALRDKLGLYSTGIHTGTFTLKDIGTTGAGYNNGQSYTYTTYTFTDSKNIEYEMEYNNSNGLLNLIEGNKYSVTFEVTKGTFDYEFKIKSVVTF